MRVYIVRAIPDEIEHARAIEQHDRGAVTLGGVSEVFEACIGQAISLTIGGGTPRMPQSSEDFDFNGEMIVYKYEMDPEDLVEHAEEADGKDEGEEGEEEAEGEEAPETPLQVAGIVPMTLEVADGTQSRLARLSVASRTVYSKRQGRVGTVVKPRSIPLPCHVTVREFPPPGAPMKLHILTRTNTALTVAWEPPPYWGGCALRGCKSSQLRKCGAPYTTPTSRRCQSHARSRYSSSGAVSLFRDIVHHLAKVRASTHKRRSQSKENCGVASSEHMPNNRFTLPPSSTEEKRTMTHLK